MNSVMTKQFYKKRSDFEKSCVTRDEKLTFPDRVDFSENIAYADDNKKAHRMDIFRPQNAKDTMLPVIINVHGGGLLLLLPHKRAGAQGRLLYHFPQEMLYTMITPASLLPAAFTAAISLAMSL